MCQNSFLTMFIKKIVIPAKKTGKRYTYYRLCESYRIGGAPRHRNILDLGTLEELPDNKERKLLADFIEQIVYRKSLLIEPLDSEKIKKLAEHFAKIIIHKRLVDVPSAKPSGEKGGPPTQDFQQVDVNSLEHSDVREVGAEWLCKQTLERLKLDDYLEQLGWDERWIKIAMMYLIGRTVFPASDLKTEDWIRRNSAVAELFHLDPQRITRHHLYKVSRMLYKEQAEIERYLSVRTSELFDLDDKIVLYDLTNTYFEGQKKNSMKAKFGKSKEKRSDAKLMALALVVNAEGFVKYSRVYEGNMRDHKTLRQTLEDIEKSGGKMDSKKVVVMDAGIATEDNLKMMREEGYDYVCISLSKMKNYNAVDSEEMVELRDKHDNKIYVQWVEVEGKDDKILYVKSDHKQLKESSMEALFCQRYEEGMAAIAEGIKKKHGTKKRDKVHERIGRLKEKYPSVYRYYKIKVSVRKGIVKKMEWEKVADSKSSNGVYFIRTTLPCKEEKTLWNIYNTIREIESVFRILKTDLKMRPVFHQEDIYSEPHIYSSILAYTIVQSVRYPLKAHGIPSDWSNIVRTMNAQKAITTTMKTKTEKTIWLRKCSEPDADVRQIYYSLGYKDRPFWQKKSVLPKTENPKPENLDTGEIRDG